MTRLIRPLVVILIFFAALAGLATLLGPIEPLRDVPVVGEKWTHWRAHKDEFDTLFIGTSRTFRGVMPSIFDQLTAGAGVPTRSYNFGVDAMFPPEDAYVAEALLRDPPRNLRWVFIEQGLFISGFEGRPPTSVRTIYWHDWTRTRLCLRETLWPKKRGVKWSKWFEPDDEKPSPASNALTHLHVFLLKALNIGRGSSAWSRVVFNTPSNAGFLGLAADGFEPSSGDGVMRGHELERYEREYAERVKTPTRVVPLRPYSLESFERQLRFARKAGARTIFIVAPTTGELSGHPAPELGVPTFDFRDLVKFPELFAKEHRTDIAHMNAKGAELYTRRLAEKFIELAKTQPPTTR
ncbi:MAG: hypothetical protein ABMA13_08055 [Chthoniobacteraceae bacterium]